MTEYDPNTCITAGELRAAGAKIPDSVPDCGWIPRSAMRVVVGKAKMVNGRVSAPMQIVFTEGFRWIGMTIEVKG